MNMLKCCKCICCLIKCCKILYFAKKLVCLCAAAIAAGAIMMNFFDKKSMKKLISRFKAVM